MQFEERRAVTHDLAAFHKYVGHRSTLRRGHGRQQRSNLQEAQRRVGNDLSAHGSQCALAKRMMVEEYPDRRSPNDKRI